MYRLRLGTSVNFDDDFYENLQKVKNLAFDSIDWDLCSFWTSPEKQDEKYKQIEKGLEAIKVSGLFLNGIHISFGDRWDISEPEKTKRRENTKRVIGLMNRIDVYNPFCYIIHGSFEPIFDDDREKHLSSLIVSLNELKNQTSHLLCVENLPRTCLLNDSAEINYVLSKCAGCFMCLDVNHFLRERTEDVLSKIDGKKVKTLHISDHDYVNERHWLPGKGKIDWMKLISELEKIGYNGVFNYEVNVPYEEIKNNYLSLFEKYDHRDELKA